MSLSNASVCEEHEDAVIVYRDKKGCPLCEAETQLENARILAEEIKNQLEEANEAAKERGELA